MGREEDGRENKMGGVGGEYDRIETRNWGNRTEQRLGQGENRMGEIIGLGR